MHNLLEIMLPVKGKFGASPRNRTELSSLQNWHITIYVCEALKNANNLLQRTLSVKGKKLKNYIIFFIKI